MSELLLVSDVGKQINRQAILEKVQLAVPAGRVLALCGGNGAGKSTLLRIIVGITKPTKGIIRLMGVERRSDPVRYASFLGYMPDDYHFTQQSLSALETLRFWATLKGADQARAAVMLRKVGLEEAQRKKVSAFSKGMRQRLLFAQALLAAPPLLVLDEPTNGLDPRWMESFVSLVLEAKQNGHGIIFSTHQLDIAEAVADEIYFLKDGVAVRSERGASLRQQYGI